MKDTVTQLRNFGGSAKSRVADADRARQAAGELVSMACPCRHKRTMHWRSDDANLIPH